MIERQDKLAQVISWSIASRTGQYTSEHPASPIEPVYDPQWIRNALYAFAEREKHARLFFALNGIVPLHVSYENLTADPTHCVHGICEWLGQPQLECKPDRVRLRRQRAEINVQWRERFLNSQNGGS